MKAVIVAAVLAAATVPAHSECGQASWYDSNGSTASGERMNGKKRTAAHRSLGFGTRLRVTNPLNGKTTEVVVNDRGPHVRGRLIDLSRAAANDLGIMKAGVGRVCFSHK